MSRFEGVWAKAAAATQASAAARRGERFMMPILRCTLTALSNRPETPFFQAEHAPQEPSEMTDAAHPIRIRKIGHVGLYCRDLAKMVDFYTRVLGFKVSDVNEKGMTFLRFGSDHHSFVLAKMADEDQKKGAGATVLQQIAMEVASLDALKRIRKTLLDQGVNVRGKIKHEGPGNDYTFDFDDPEGNRLQFFSDMDRIGWDGKSRPKEQWKRFEVDD
jgi:catechol 2,3-dioxygenase-like lactoylglutathione lyase family enzyme